MLSVALTGWYVGFAVAGILIAVVVVLVAGILTFARRIAGQALDIDASLAESEVRTLALWDVSVVNDGLRDILKGAAAARAALEAK